MNRRLVVIMLALAAAAATSLLPLAGCGSSTTSTSVPDTTRPSTDSNVKYLDPQPVDLAAITNLDKADLSDAEKQVLARQSFVAVGLPAEEASWKFWMIYENARYQGLPVMITTDSMLNAYHSLFNMLLQRMEESVLFDQAVLMTKTLYSSAYDQWSTATDLTIKNDAWINRVYFAVGSALLDPTASVPTEMITEVEAEVALIEAAAGPAESPVLGYVEDYSQYRPRGHYTRSERLERYFKAMMWYGHTGFFINPRDPDITEAEAASLTRRAILISSSLVGPAQDAWNAIYEPTSFLVGRADDLTLKDMQQVVAQVFGTAQPEADALADETKIASVREALNKLPAPKIQSAAVPDLSDDTSGGASREDNQRSFRVMGQRYIPDSYAFQQLVWDYVGTQDNKRTLPMGLDIMTVLGSKEAYRLETELYGQQRYANWETQVRKVEQEFSQPGSDLWPANLYTGWLESLQKVMGMPDAGAPTFMRSQPWALKSLNAALGSWTELRHDTILYAKQSVTAEGEGGEEPVSPGYVEPYPAFFNGIAELADSLKQGLTAYDLLDSESAAKLDRMITVAQALATIAQKELSASALTDEEINLIQTYGGELESLEQFDTDEQGLTLSPAPEKSALVADVHSDYVTAPAQVLEEATGYPLSLYAAFELDGAMQLFIGASYSYYEFTAPADKRLTDEEWTALLDAGDAPPRPQWTDEWIVQR
jgi:hypothetical protein